VHNGGNANIGLNGTGTITIDDGSASSVGGNINIGQNAGATGVAALSTGSTWTTDVDLRVGVNGNGTLNILSASTLTARRMRLGDGGSSTSSVVLVDGIGSVLRTTAGSGTGLQIGGGSGTTVLTISNGGLVDVAGGNGATDGGISIGGTGSINIDIGGMLAYDGDTSANLAAFLGGITGTDPIFYWDGSAFDDITNGVEGVNYTLDFGNIVAGSTTLTVTAIPTGIAVADGSRHDWHSRLP